MNKVNPLIFRKCLPCMGKIPPLTYPKLKELLPLVPHWRITRPSVTTSRLERHVRYPTFRDAMSFLNRVAEIAENEGHHPDFSLGSYNQIKLVMFTHSIGSVTENDFIVAAKIDAAI